MKNLFSTYYLFISLVCLAFISEQAFSQSNQTALPVKEVLEKELNGGESHLYKIQSGDNFYLRLVVEQKGIDVIVTLYDSNKNKLSEMDSPNGTQGVEIISYIVEKAGDYLIEVKSPAKESPKGIYLIELEKFTPVTEQNRNLFQADKLFFEAEQWKLKPTAESVQNAMVKYQEAQKNYQLASDVYGEATVLNNLGFLLYNIGMPDKAEVSLIKALKMFEEVKSQVNIASATSNLGATFNALGKTQESIEYYEKAADLFKLLKDLKSEATVRSNLGKSLTDIGQPDQALAEYEKALAIYRTISDKRLEAIILNNMGVLFDSLGNFQKAIEYFQRVLPLFREVKERRGEGIILNNIGSAYRRLGDFQTAKEYYLQALPILTEVNDRLNQAYILSNLGEVDILLGNPSKTKTNYEAALKLFQEIKDRRSEAHVLSNLGLYYSKTDNKKATEYYLQSLPIRKETADRPGEALTNLYLAESYFAVNDLANAKVSVEKALPLSREVGDKDTEAKSLYNLSLLEDKQGNLSQARLNIEEAIKIVENNRAQIRSNDLKTSYFALFQNFYQHYIRILMKSHQENPKEQFDEKAFEISERSRARSLADLLSESNIDIRQGVDAGLLEKEKLSRQQISAVAEKLFRLPQKTSEKDQLRLEKELSTQKLNLQQISAEIKIKSPQYSALSQPQILSVSEVQSLLDENTVLLEYSLGEKQSYLWIVGKNQFNSITLPARHEIETKAKKFYELLTSRQERENENTAQFEARVAKSDNEYPKYAKELSQMLFGSIYPQLKNKRLLVVSDGILQYLSFAVLPTPTDTSINKLEDIIPLVVNNEIVNLPSASLLSVLLKARPNRPAQKMVISFADAVFNENDDRLATVAGKMNEKLNQPNKIQPIPALNSLRGDGLNLKRLGYSRDEADIIAGLTSSENRKSFVDFEANLQQVKTENFSNFRIIHFATHGIFNSQNPELSGLVFSLFDDKGNPRNGFLGLSDIYNLKMPAEMVVLSACQTALGKDVRGEGLVGLTRGFMYAGTKRVVASLWNVNDDSTSQLMTRMYLKILKEKKSPASALRQAQIEMWKRKPYNHPFYWAGFTIQGDFR